MDKLSKSREEICKDCEKWVIVSNCRECLFNVFKKMDNYSPFSWDDENNENNKM
jgi:hypothetical protein